MHRDLLIGVMASIVCFCLGCAKGFNRGEMANAAPTSQLTFASPFSVEEIEKLKPQIKLPIKLAVAPPVASNSWWRWQELKTWSPDEIAEIESWSEPLKKEGVISDLYILPANVFEQCKWDDAECKMRVNRTSAARVQADAVLILNLTTTVDEYSNPVSVLNLTIIGMWIAPGHHRDALTIVEGAMIDNRNEYLYAYARGQATESIIRPYMYAETWKAVRPSRLHALQAFGREFVKQTAQLKTK